MKMDVHDNERQNLGFRPKYALPEELLAFEKEETICQYCGVSYLIFTELKNMENNVFNLTSEITILKEKGAFFENLNQDFQNCQREIEELKKIHISEETKNKNLADNFREKENSIESLKLDLMRKETQIYNISEKYKLQCDLWTKTRIEMLEVTGKLRDVKRMAKSCFFDENQLRKLTEPLKYFVGEVLSKCDRNRSIAQQMKAKAQQREEALQERIEIIELRIRQVKQETETRVCEMAEKLGQAEGRIGELSIELTSEKGLSKKLENKLVASELANHEIKDNLEKLIAELNEMKEGDKSRFEEIQMKLDSGEGKLSAASKELEMAQTKVDLIQEKYKNTLEILKMARKSVKALQTFGSKLVADINKIKMFVKVEAERIQTHALSKIPASYSSKLEQVKGVISKDLQLAWAETEEQKASLSRELARLKSEHANLQRASQPNENMKTALNNTIKRLQVSLVEMRQQVIDKDQENRRLSEAYQALQGKAKPKEDFTKYKLLLKKQLEDCHQLEDRDQLEDRELLKKQLEDRENEIERLKRIVQRECEEREELSEALDEAKAQLSELLKDSTPPGSVDRHIKVHGTRKQQSKSKPRAVMMGLQSEVRLRRNPSKLSSSNSIVATKRRLAALVAATSDIQ